MSMNIKPINEVPFIEALTENDSVLVNSGGVAKQIPASKIGGRGGGGKPVYISIIEGDFSSESMVVKAFDDEALTSQLTFAEGVERFLGGSVLAFKSETEDASGVVSITPLFSSNTNETKISMCMVNMGNEAPTEMTVAYSDSVI